MALFIKAVHHSRSYVNLERADSLSVHEHVDHWSVIAVFGEIHVVVSEMPSEVEADAVCVALAARANAPSEKPKPLGRMW